MRTFYKCLILLIAIAMGGTALAAATVSAPQRGVIRVKLQPEVALKVGHLPKVQSRGGVLQTGIAPLDRAASQVKAVSIRRMIPYSPQLEAKHAKYGLDRWYEVSFDENFSAADARKIFGNTAGVEISEVITPMSLIEGDGAFVKAKAAPRKAGATMPFNDPRLSAQWHYHNDGSLPNSVAGADINLFEAWKTTTGTPNVLVAIIDGGVDYKHEDLAQNMFVNTAELNGLPGVDDDGNGYVDDIYGFNFCTKTAEIYPHPHGTHVAGTVAAVNNNGTGVAGVAGGDGSANSGVRMISCQVFESRSGTPEGDFAAAIVYAADMGATIAQCSWGWESAEYKEQAVLDAIDYFTESARSDVMTGGLCIFAAGNLGQTGNFYPAAYEPVVAVGAMTSSLAPASYSNWGEWVDIIAPGGLLDYNQAEGVLSTLPNNEYGYNEGTSMATPHVSGIAALVLSKYGSKTFVNSNLRTQLLSSVNDLYGKGNNAQYAGLYGSGYIDAAKALQFSTEGTPAAVSDFNLTAGQDNVIVDWTIPANDDNAVSSHIIYYSDKAFTAATLDGAKTAPVDTRFLSSGDKTSYEISGLQPLTTYYVAIAAVNRWGRASELSAVKSVSTNAGPTATVDNPSLSISTDASAATASASFTLKNEGEGLLKWEGAKATVRATLKSIGQPNPGNVRAYSGRLGTNAVKPMAATTAVADYEAGDYPADIADYDHLVAFIGDQDKTLPNSLGQQFTVDANEYPEGFNLTHVVIEGANGKDPVIQIYKGNAAINNSTLVQTISYDWFTYGYNIALNEQIFFAPGESFWIVVHFEGGQEGYPLGMAFADNPDTSTAYMSNDRGKTWVNLPEALKGSSYEANSSHYIWAVKARSLNPDWSRSLTLSPASGTVKAGESQKVDVTADRSKLVNGSYTMNVKLATNDHDNPTVTIPVSLTVDGNQPDVEMPKIVEFGNILVGQSKTITVEAFNKGYGSFRGSSFSAGVYSENVISSSEHFIGPDYLPAGFPARTVTKFEITYTPLSAGSHSGTITFKDVNGREVKVLVQGSATNPAKLAVEPEVVEAGTLLVGAEPTEVKFTVSNQGDYPMEYVFPKFSDENIADQTASLHKFGYTVASTLEGYNAMEYTAPAQLIGATDITAKFTDSNYYSDAINPGFNFPFYGKEYDTLYITSFGAILFGVSEENLWSPLESSSSSLAGIGAISVYGRQLQFAPDSKVMYAKKDGKFVVYYSNVLALVYDQDYIPASFRIELSPNGDIELFYDQYEAQSTFQQGSSLYCGILDPEMADGITLTDNSMADIWGYEEATADNQRFRAFNSPCAVKFEAPKASFITAISSAHGLLSPKESVEITATLAADENMNAGETFNNLAIVTNDPAPSLAAIRINAVIDGEGLDAKAALEQTEIDFGKVFRTSDTKVAIQVKNTGRRAMNVTEVKAEAGKVNVEAEVPFTIQPGNSKDILVTIPTDKEGAVADKVLISTTAGQITAAIKGQVIGVPVATLNMAEITETVASGEPLVKTLTVKNEGNEDLVYSVAPDGLYRLTTPERKNTKVSYTYSSSLDDKNVKFDWVDIETNGLGTQNTLTYYLNHDFVAVDLPFEFPFYGKKYSKMYVYNSGFVSFTQRKDDRLWPEPPAEFPQGTVYNNLIAPYWGLHSMDQTKTAGTFYYVTDDRAVVSFMEYGNSMNFGVCYQLIMEKDGSFKFQYKGAGEMAIIYGMFGLAGISNDDASQSLRVPERMVQFGQAIQFTPASENVLPAGISDEITLDFDTDRLAGLYEGAVNITTNVPGKENIQIPVALTITGESAPVWPADITVEHTVGYRSTDFDNPIVQMGACYDAAFSIANEGTAMFTIMQANVGGPQIYDEYFDEYSPAFWLFAEQPAIDWITGEPTGEYTWTQYTGEPLEIGEQPIKFSIPMLEGELWMTPGEYEVPITFTYVEGSLANYYAAMEEGQEVEPKQHTVNVKFIVTPCPAMTIDKTEVYLQADKDDFKSTETITIGNEGEYKLTYSLRLDPTGIGEETGEQGGGGVAPLQAQQKSAMKTMSTDLVESLVKPMLMPFDTKTSSYTDVPTDFEFNEALYYPLMPGTEKIYNFGSGTLYDTFREAVCFKAPADGFNISHIYLPVTIGKATNFKVNIDLVQGSDPDAGAVVGSTDFTIAKQETELGRYFVVPFEKPVFMNPDEEFCVVVTYAAGHDYPAYIIAKEEAVVPGRYLAYADGFGWYDLGQNYEDSYGSIGYILSCLETSEGQPWVKMLTTETEGVVEVGQTAQVKIAVNAAAARMEKGNTAMLVIKSNDPNQPVVNLPIILDLNGKPVITAPEGTVVANEGEVTEVKIAVSDPDYDDITIVLDDPDAMATIKAVAAGQYDTEATVTAGDDGSYTVSGAFAPVTVTVQIAPDFGQAGADYAFSLSATDAKGHETQAVVNYAVEKVNRAPKAVDIETVYIDIDEMSSLIAYASLFTDPDGDELTYEFTMAENKVAEAMTSSRGVIFQGLAYGKVYATVTATDPAGLSATQYIKVVVADPAGVNDIEGANADGIASIMENPVKTDLRVLSNVDGDMTFALFDASGRAIASESAAVVSGTVHSIDMGRMAAGYYILVVTADQRSATFGIIKQ